MKDYSKGKIYCIRSFQTDMVYVGSTIQSLSMRMAGHRRCYKKYLNGKYNYVSSFEILQYGDAYIELIKLYPCSSNSELVREEGQFIRVMNCVNKKISGRTKKEYRQENKEHLAIYNKKYNEKNKEHIAVKKKETYQKNKAILTEKFKCECGGKYSYATKSRHFKSQKHQKYLNEKI